TDYEYGGTAVELFRGRLEQSSIHLGASGYGVYLGDSAMLQTVDIVGGWTGVAAGCCSTGHSYLNDVTVTNTSDVGLDLEDVIIGATSANVLVSGSASYGYMGTVGNFATLFPDSLRQETLLGNARDTAFITGGTLTNATALARPGLPWLVWNDITVDTLGVLVAHPGASFSTSYSSFFFQAGGTLDAHGSAARPVYFGPDVDSDWYGLSFNNPGTSPDGFEVQPVAQSTLTNVIVDRALGLCAYGTYYYCYNPELEEYYDQSAVSGADRHRVMIDSSRIHRSYNGAVTLLAAGSWIDHSLIDTTGNPTTAAHAVGLGSGTEMRRSRV